MRDSFKSILQVNDSPWSRSSKLNQNAGTSIFTLFRIGYINHTLISKTFGSCKRDEFFDHFGGLFQLWIAIVLIASEIVSTGLDDGSQAKGNGIKQRLNVTFIVYNFIPNFKNCSLQLFGTVAWAVLFVHFLN